MADVNISAEIGVFGGSGFYDFLTDVHEVLVDTPYGAPSDRVTVATVGDRKVAFLPRHGKGHIHPAHVVNYRANVWALKSLGVQQILAPFSCGSLQRNIHPGDFVIVDQFVDRTSGRQDTYFNGPITHHIGAADPYCLRLSALAVQVALEQGVTVHEGGTVVVCQGPRFSTRAESEWFTKNGWDIVGMTQYPECILARELGICFVGVGLVTDYDVGMVAEQAEPVTFEMVVKTMQENVHRVRDLILEVIKRLPAFPADADCACAGEARAAIING